jgi:hypothetical protein
MEVLAALLLWVGFSVAVAVAANTRGRNAAIWLLVSILASPLIAGLILLALPKANQQTSHFRPDEVIGGVACRFRPDGAVDAMMPGGIVRFSTAEQFLAAVPHAATAADSLRDKAKAVSQYPNIHNGYRFRMNANGSVDAIAPDGSPKKFNTWRAFWDEASPQGHQRS